MAFTKYIERPRRVLALEFQDTPAVHTALGQFGLVAQEVQLYGRGFLWRIETSGGGAVGTHVEDGDHLVITDQDIAQSYVAGKPGQIIRRSSDVKVLVPEAFSALPQEIDRSDELEQRIARLEEAVAYLSAKTQ